MVGGVSALRRSRQLAPAADTVTEPLSAMVGIENRPQRYVELNAGLQIVGGSLLALGVVPRIASLTLACSMVPTTVAGHRFWELSGEERRAELIQFLKNAAIFGGLLSAALDTGGRPSVFWVGRQQAADTVSSVADMAANVGQTVARLNPAA